MSMIAIIGAIQVGLVYALVALGVFLSFRVLEFPDLTVDGSFPLGAATAATLITTGMDPVSATAIAILTQHDFHHYFGDMLDIMVYVLVPWSAINLADYYFVRSASYSVKDMFDLNGLYGRFNWSTIAIYFLAIVIQAPFARLSFYTGVIAERIGADTAWIPGLIVPAALYCIIEPRRMARGREASVV